MLLIAIIGISHALFIALFFITKTKKELRDWIIVMFMLILAMPLISQAPLFDPGSRVWFLNLRSYPFLFGPFLYIFTRVMISEKPELKKSDTIHILPFFIMSLVSLWLFSDSTPFRIGPGMEGFVGEMDPGIDHFPSIHHLAPHPPKHPPLPDRLYAFATIFSLLSYSTLVLWLLRTHSKHIKNYFSSQSLTITLNWLKWLTIAFVFAILYVVITGYFGPEIEHIPWLRHKGSHIMSITFFIVIFGFINMKQPLIFSDTTESEMEKNSEDDINLDKKYHRSGLKEDDARDYLEKIETYIQNEKPYQDGDLTIVTISEKLNIPRHHLTQVLNEKLGKNFYSYINEYRIEDIKQLIADKDNRDQSLLRLAFDVGFNSKSSFNKIFKEYTGLTPTQYRNQYN